MHRFPRQFGMPLQGVCYRQFRPEGVALGYYGIALSARPIGVECSLRAFAPLLFNKRPSISPPTATLAWLVALSFFLFMPGVMGQGNLVRLTPGKPVNSLSHPSMGHRAAGLPNFIRTHYIKHDYYIP